MQLLDEDLLEGEAGVVGADGDAFRHTGRYSVSRES
jgi:hypothetical protein